MMHFLCLGFAFISFALCGEAGATDSQLVIGQSFYIPGIDLNTEELHGGIQIFSQVNDCIGEQPFRQTDHHFTFFKSTESFYSSVSSDTKISATFQTHFTLGFTLDVTTKSISGRSRNVTGMTYTDMSLTKQVFLQLHCLKTPNLDSDLLSRFESLPSSISEPWTPSGWSAYQMFLNRYGSHVVKTVFLGTAINQHTFSDSSLSYSESNLKTKICAQISDPINEKTLNAKACAGIEIEDLSKVSFMSVSDRFIARGGSLETRAELRLKRKDTTIEKLLSEAETFGAPVKYTFVPIWDILKEKYFGTEHQAKVHNLQSYYSGFRNYGCKYLKKYEPQLEEQYEFQKFEVLDQTDANGNPIFQCSILNEGCQTTDDCDWSYYQGRLWDWRCYCKNGHCIQHDQADLNTGVTKPTPHFYPFSWDEGWQGNCKAIDDEPYCKCTTSAKRHVLWSSEDNWLYSALNGTKTTSGCSGFGSTKFTVSLFCSSFLCLLISNFYECF